MRRVLLVAALAVGLGGASHAVAQSAPQRPGPGGPPNVAGELQQLQTQIRQLGATVKALEEKLNKLDQARRPASPPMMGSAGMGGSFGTLAVQTRGNGTPSGPAMGGFSTNPFGGGMSGSVGSGGGGFGGGPGSAFGGVGPATRGTIVVAARNDDQRPSPAPFADRPEPRGPRAGGGRDLDRKLDNIMRELQEIRRELRSSRR